MSVKTHFKFNFDEKFCFSCCYSSEMSSACSTNLRLIASVLTVFEDRCFRFHFDDTVGALVARQEVPFGH